MFALDYYNVIKELKIKKLFKKCIIIIKYAALLSLSTPENGLKAKNFLLIVTAHIYLQEYRKRLEHI